MTNVTRASNAVPSAGHTVPSMATNDSNWLSLTDISDELGVSIDTLYKWRAEGEFPPASRLPNGSIRVQRADLDEWIYGRSA